MNHITSKTLATLCIMLSLSLPTAQANETSVAVRSRLILTAEKAEALATKSAADKGEVLWPGSFDHARIDARIQLKPKRDWPQTADAPALRELLTDPQSAVRALAIDALASLDQLEDIPRIASLLGDKARGSWGYERSQLHIAIIHGKPTSPGMVWRMNTVADSAGAALLALTGNYRLVGATPQVFQTWWAVNSDAKNSLWYWRKELGKDPSNVYHPQALRLKLRQESPETEAKVLLMTGFEGVFRTSSEALRLSPDRLMALLEGTSLWPDVEWNGDNRSALFEGLTRHGSPILQPKYASRIAELLKNTPQDSWWAHKPLMLALSRSQATVLEQMSVLRAAAETSKDQMVRGAAMAEIISMGLPAESQFVKTRFFADTDHQISPDTKQQVLIALGKTPLTPAKRILLCDLVLDARFTPYLTKNTHVMGDDMWRKYAIWSLNAHAGKEIIPSSSPQEYALRDSATSKAAVADFHQKVRALRDAKP